MTEGPDLQKLFEKMSLALVQCNTSWSRVENAMAGLLESLLSWSADNVALHVYFAPNNTETRFKIVDTVARLKWQNYSAHDLMAEWTSIFTALGKAKEVRNRLAHGEIQIPGRKLEGDVWN